MKNNHNGIISFWKFMFSLMMLALHLGILHPEARYNFNSGSIGVEFFFIVSGYLFCKKYIKKSVLNNEKIGKITIYFFITKIKRFLPYILFLWIISLPYSIIVDKYRIYDFTLSFFNTIYIPVRGRVSDIHGITWYIMAMIFIQTILFPIINKYKENFIYLISPIIVFLSGNYLIIKYGAFNPTWSPNVYFYGGIVRALFDINIGMILYLISKKIEKTNLTDFSKFMMTIIEIVGYSSIFIIVNIGNAHIKYDYIMVIIIAISITISFSGKSLMNEFCNNKIFYYLEKISLPIYINQWYLIHLIDNIINKYKLNISYYKELVIVIIISIVIAIFTNKIVDLYNEKKQKISRIFIEG